MTYRQARVLRWHCDISQSDSHPIKRYLHIKTHACAYQYYDVGKLVDASCAATFGKNGNLKRVNY